MELSRLGNQCMYLMSVCQPNSTSSHKRLASRLGGHIHYLLYANLIRNYRILGWHPGFKIFHYKDFKLPSYDQKGYKSKNTIQISAISNIKRRKQTAKTLSKYYMSKMWKPLHTAWKS